MVVQPVTGGAIFWSDAATVDQTLDEIDLEGQIDGRLDDIDQAITEYDAVAPAEPVKPTAVRLPAILAHCLKRQQAREIQR